MPDSMTEGIAISLYLNSTGNEEVLMSMWRKMGPQGMLFSQRMKRLPKQLEVDYPGLYIAYLDVADQYRELAGTAKLEVIRGSSAESTPLDYSNRGLSINEIPLQGRRIAPRLSHIVRGRGSTRAGRPPGRRPHRIGKLLDDTTVEEMLESEPSRRYEQE